MFVAEGFTLHLICEESKDLHGSPSVQPSTQTDHIKWTRKRINETGYTPMEQDGFYTIAKKTNGKEIRELWKHNVTLSDSAEYHCQNNVTRPDTVNVTVIKSGEKEFLICKANVT